MALTYLVDLDVGEDISDFVSPPLGSGDEIDSFNFQAKAVNFTPAPKELEQAICAMERAYSSCKWEVPEDFLSDAHVRRVCQHVRDKLGEKSPGAILLRAGMNSNTMVFEQLGMDALVAMVTERIHDLLAAADPRYVSDPIRLFIKREPHKKSKAVDKRWRLIWGVSLVDNIIDRLLYTIPLQKEIENCASIPSKPGYSFKYGGTDKMVRQYGATRSDKWRSFDAKSFDISAPEWGLRLSRTVTSRLCLTRATNDTLFQKWEALSVARDEACLFGSFVFSNGVVCRKTKACIQPSGRLTTIKANCMIVVGSRFCYDISKGEVPDPMSIIAMGDDTVQDHIKDPDEFVDYVREKHGITFTVESEPGPFEKQNFCSTEFRKLDSGVFVPIPLNWKKNAYQLCHPETKVARNKERLDENRGSCLQSLCCEYAFAPQFKQLHTLLAVKYPDRWRSQEYFQALVTGWECAEATAKGWEQRPSYVLDHAAMLA